MKKFLIKNTVALMMALGLAACDDKTAQVATSKESTVQQAVDFTGCYTIKKDGPAQIKISQTDGKWVMQMKEPQSSDKVWDNPEALVLIDTQKAWEFFGVNALGLDRADVEAVLARPDNMMLLAKVKSASKNVNPLLDSEFVVYIFRGSNTIYPVACDETPIDFTPKNPHAL